MAALDVHLVCWRKIHARGRRLVHSGVRSVPACSLSFLLLVLAGGCSDQSLRPHPDSERADLYWSLALNHHAVALDTMAPYDTLQLVATPRNYRDEPLAGLPAAQYRSTDPERVSVRPDGMLIALAPTSQSVAVVATLTANNLKHADTVMVNVVATAAPPVLDSFSIHPIPPDSAKVGASILTALEFWDTLPVRAATRDGERIPIYGRDDRGYLPVYFRLSDTTIAALLGSNFYGGGVGVLKGLHVGSVNIYASTTAFGVSRVDTLAYRVGVPIIATDMILGSSPGYIMNLAPSTTIAMGGAVYWFNRVQTLNNSDTLDITFDDADLPNVASLLAADHLGLSWFCADPAQCPGGNVQLSQSQPIQFRYFPTPGTYEYRSLKAGFTGRIVVVDER